MKQCALLSLLLKKLLEQRRLIQLDLELDEGAVEISRIMRGDAVAKKLAMVFYQKTPSSGVSKNSQMIFCNKLLLL